MPGYLVPSSRFDGNFIFANDGSVWSVYCVAGVIYNAYEPDTISSAQRSQQRLFQALAGCPSNDILLLGIKTRTEPEEILRACVAGLPDFSSARYEAYARQLNAMYQEYKSGKRFEYNREYILAVKLKAEQGAVDKLLGRDVEVANPANIQSAEQVVFEALPPDYLPRRATPHHLRLIQERFVTRGLAVPFSLRANISAAASFGPQSFPAYIFDKFAQIDAYADDFAARFAKSERSKARDKFRANWRTAEQSTMCAVIDPDSRTPDQPEGAVSYQMLLAVLSYPAEESSRLNIFTNIVDQEIYIDADFAQRISFDTAIVTKEGAREARRNLQSEANASAEDSFDMDEYTDVGDEQNEFRSQVRSENAHVAIKVATIFAFAHPNWRHLQNQVANIQTLFANNYFDLRTIPGASEDLWKLMAPGQPLTALGRELQQTSTITKFASSLPVRTIRIGSATGFPVAINTENALRQIVRMDLMRSTEAGSGSIAASGEPRAGKSHFVKMLAYAYLDQRGTVHCIDMSTHGEYAVFAYALPPGESVVVNVARGTHSMDPLRVYHDDPATAHDVFLDLWLPMLQIDPKSSAGTTLINLLETRAGGVIASTRDLFEHLRRKSQMSGRADDDPLRVLYSAFLPYANAAWSTLLIDPVEAGSTRPVPVLGRDNAPRLVVFRTNQLTPPRKGQDRQVPRELFTSAAYLAIARYTQERFSRINDVCVTVADEIAFLGDDRVPEILIKTPDKMGAKEKNLLITSTQLTQDFDANYALIPYRFAFRQRVHENAEAALTWANVPVTPSTLQEITSMSPVDETTKQVEQGREGECYMNVNGIARVKILPMAAERARLSDTTASRMVREDELADR